MSGKAQVDSFDIGIRQQFVDGKIPADLRKIHSLAGAAEVALDRAQVPLERCWIRTTDRRERGPFNAPHCFEMGAPHEAEPHHCHLHKTPVYNTLRPDRLEGRPTRATYPPPGT